MGEKKEWDGMEEQKLRLDCGCEIWEGHHDRPYIVVEHCPKHYVRVHDLSVEKVHDLEVEKIEQESVKKG